MAGAIALGTALVPGVLAVIAPAAAVASTGGAATTAPSPFDAGGAAATGPAPSGTGGAAGGSTAGGAAPGSPTGGATGSSPASAGGASPTSPTAAGGIAATASTSTQSTARGHATVRLGSHGPAVALLQRDLRLAADGIFGPRTQRAVRAFQRRHHLRADGIVGPQTWRALGTQGTPPSVPGSQGAGASASGSTAGANAPPAAGNAGGAGIGSTSGAPDSTASGPPTGTALAEINAMVAGGDEIATLPYRYGGGHLSFIDTAYDCSGSVSFVLHAAGLLANTETSGELMTYGLPGPGRWVTIYSNPTHVFMVILGRRFDTADQSRDGSRWHDTMRSTDGFVVRHPAGL